MSARSQKDKGQKQNTHQLILADLLKEEANRYCSDCGAKGPRWASWNLGVFLCIRCAGIHRNLGVHISRVKSVNLDSWTPEQMDSIQQWGNQRAAEFWECYLPTDFRRPQTDSAMEAFIRGKYERKQYLKKDGLPPSRTSNNTAGKEVKSPDKVKKRREKKDEQITITPLGNNINKKVAPPASSAPKTIAQPRPHSHPAPVKAPEPAKPAALVDLFSLDTPAPAPVSSAAVQTAPAQALPPAALPAKTSLENELIDFGAFQQSTIDTGFSPAQQLNSQVPPETEDSLFKDDSSSSKSTKDSIMALYTPNTQHQQPQMYGIPGGMYITPQQPPQQAPQQLPPQLQHGQQQPAAYNRMAGFPVQPVHQPVHQPVQMGMGTRGPQSFMQQQQQVAQIQQQMQHMRLKQQMAPQQPNMCGGPNMFGQPPATSNWVPQQPMSFPQQQHPQYITTGPSGGNMGYGAYPMGSPPGSGQTLSHQLWK